MKITRLFLRRSLGMNLSNAIENVAVNTNGTNAIEYVAENSNESI